MSRYYGDTKADPFDPTPFSEKIGVWAKLDNNHNHRMKLSYEGVSDLRCARCKNQMWKNSGYFFRPRNKKEWIVFCRIDCAHRAISDKIEELVTFDQYINKVIMSKP